jgi:hypothetical protein
VTKRVIKRVAERNAAREAANLTAQEADTVVIRVPEEPALTEAQLAAVAAEYAKMSVA